MRPFRSPRLAAHWATNLLLPLVLLPSAFHPLNLGMPVYNIEPDPAGYSGPRQRSSNIHNYALQQQSPGLILYYAINVKHGFLR